MGNHNDGLPAYIHHTYVPHYHITTCTSARLIALLCGGYLCTSPPTLNSLQMWVIWKREQTNGVDWLSPVGECNSYQLNIIIIGFHASKSIFQHCWHVSALVVFPLKEFSVHPSIQIVILIFSYIIVQVCCQSLVLQILDDPVPCWSKFPQECFVQISSSWGSTLGKETNVKSNLC